MTRGARSLAIACSVAFGAQARAAEEAPPACGEPASERPPDPRCGEPLDGRPEDKPGMTAPKAALLVPREAARVVFWPFVEGGDCNDHDPEIHPDRP